MFGNVLEQFVYHDNDFGRAGAGLYAVDKPEKAGIEPAVGVFHLIRIIQKGYQLTRISGISVLVIIREYHVHKLLPLLEHGGSFLLLAIVCDFYIAV